MLNNVFNHPTVNIYGAPYFIIHFEHVPHRNALEISNHLFPHLTNYADGVS